MKEINGLVTYDRLPKLPQPVLLEFNGRLAQANRVFGAARQLFGFIGYPWSLWKSAMVVVTVTRICACGLDQHPEPENSKPSLTGLTCHDDVWKAGM